MRSGFTIVLLVTVLFAGGYFYNLAQAVCPIPISYRVGQLDDEFDLSLDEAKVAIAEAAELWEAASGQNLFAYDEDATFTINFIFDDRQALVTEEEQLKSSLNDAENINSVLTDTYDDLVSEYETLRDEYAKRVADYEQRFAEYNQTVRDYNESGGAPADVYDELESERVALQSERDRLDALAEGLNDLVADINRLGDRGNALIENYNENVGEFNNRFGETREFTQGDYQGTQINIYTYKDAAELQTVLAHEFGHALSLQHVEGEEAVMYYLIGGQPADLQLSESDVAEFNRICGDMSLWDKIVYRLTTN